MSWQTGQERWPSDCVVIFSLKDALSRADTQIKKILKFPYPPNPFFPSMTSTNILVLTVSGALFCSSFPEQTLQFMLIGKVIICQCVSVFSAQLLTRIFEFTFIGCLRSSKSAMGWSLISPCCSGFVLLLMLSQMRKPSFCALVQLQWWKKNPTDDAEVSKTHKISCIKYVTHNNR